MDKQETLTISDGVLIASSSCPTSEGNIRRGLKNDSIWVPQISLVKPHDVKLFYGGHFLEKEGLPQYTNHPDGSSGMGIWYGFKENLQDLTAVSYGFIPGEVENPELLKRKIHNISGGFVPDKKDPIQALEPVGIFAIEDDLAYALSFSSLGINSRMEDVPILLYYLLNRIEKRVFGYNCEHSDSIGLNAQLEGKLNLNSENLPHIVNSIRDDFKKRLEAKVLSQQSI